MDARANIFVETSVPAKTQWLFEQAHFNELFEKGDQVAIKVHMGEWFNTSYLRPNIVRAMVDKVKEHGGRPFVTDTTTLLIMPFIGRTTANDYLQTAAANGFTGSSMGCPVVIADGVAGLDDVHVDVPDGILLKEAYVASGIANADAVIVLSHFKGHDVGVYGGAIKNVGVGCASKRGKMAVHLFAHPKFGIKNWPFVPEACKASIISDDVRGVIENCCPQGALHVTEEGLVYEKEKCIGCGFTHVISTLEQGAFSIPDEWRKLCLISMADSACGVMKIVGRQRMGFINVATDITPFCDCAPSTDLPIMPDLGIFASKSITAVDLACLDMSMEREGIHGTMAEEVGVLKKGTEKFTMVHPAKGSQWTQVNAAAQLGLGSKDYRVIKIEPGPREKFCHPNLTYPDKTTGSRFRDKFYRTNPIPSGGFKWRDQPRISLEELSTR
jgi:uncharacterized Fe-S center protein